MFDYYVKRSSDGLYELRQERFRGKPEHPHDVCAIARSIKEMREMTQPYFRQDSINYGLPPNCPNCHGQTESNGSGGITCFFCGYDRKGAQTDVKSIEA